MTTKNETSHHVTVSSCRRRAIGPDVQGRDGRVPPALINYCWSQLGLQIARSNNRGAPPGATSRSWTKAQALPIVPLAAGDRSSGRLLSATIDGHRMTPPSGPDGPEPAKSEAAPGALSRARACPAAERPHRPSHLLLTGVIVTGPISITIFLVWQFVPSSTPRSADCSRRATIPRPICRSACLICPARHVDRGRASSW